ncbi:feruloyl esterase b [Diaporthe amygdali]|uniref:feruloyl esterase b n=1 Tax=Phomopsis amygdali TaxID=1214568 RepID=UPI0022FEFC4D|nr:feruloyl esterase b [Diaporthe amygdali]KAJ0108862.1 feruloyl esterase b [Diaporthe amygdali]
MRPLIPLAGSVCALFWQGMGAAAAATPCSVDALQAALPSDASILVAQPVASGGTFGEGSADIPYPTNPTDLPETCAVIVNVTTSPSSSFRFSIFLPTQWNKRFLQVGNGGFAGGINFLDMGAGVRYGFAVASTDTGHNSSTSDLTWALREPEKRLDFGYRAIHGSVVLGKAITEAFYGQEIAYSYYSGASTGGRQGLREAQYDPESFDGLLIGAPAWWTSHLQPWTTKVGSYNLPTDAAAHIPPSLFTAIGAEVIQQCDSLDGVKDGIVSSPELCEFNTDALLCGSAGTNASACLTAAQLATLNSVYADYYAEGRFAFPGLEVGSEAQWGVLLGGSSPSSLGDGYMQNFVLDDPSWTWRQYDDGLVWQADAQDPGNCTADHYEAMRAVMERGSKIILFHGSSDALISTRSSNVLYSRVAEALGGFDQLHSWFRFFLVPGLQHVVGTPADVNAPWYFAGPNSQASLGTNIYSTPGFPDPEHDALLALMRWVEDGVAVDHIIATTWHNSTDPASGVFRQRPLCPFPQKAAYDGKGDVDDAGSWSCSG